VGGWGGSTLFMRSSAGSAALLAPVAQRLVQKLFEWQSTVPCLHSGHIVIARLELLLSNPCPTCAPVSYPTPPRCVLPDPTQRPTAAQLVSALGTLERVVRSESQASRRDAQKLMNSQAQVTISGGFPSGSTATP
jgi:hypothetical protein